MAQVTWTHEAQVWLRDIYDFTAADISRRRVSLEENLKALGNPDGRAERSRIVRIEHTPWCHVNVDARQLSEMSD